LRVLALLICGNALLREGDRCNAVLAAAGYNFSLLLRWLKRLLPVLIWALLAAATRFQNT